MLKKISTIIIALLSSASFASINIVPAPHDANCLTLIYCKITGHHDIEIVNESQTAKTYHISAGLNSGDGHVDAYTRKDIRLEPHEKYSDHHEYSLYEKYNNSMTYHNSVFVGVYGDETSTQNAYANVVVYPRATK